MVTPWAARIRRCFGRWVRELRPSAFDVNFNREVLTDAGRYFSTAIQVRDEIELAEADPTAALARGELGQRGAARYDWDDVGARYEELCRRLLALKKRRSPRPSGRRSGHFQT